MSKPEPVRIVRVEPPLIDLLLLSLKLWIVNLLLAVLFGVVGALAFFVLSFAGLVLAVA